MSEAEFRRERDLLNIVLHEPFGKMMEPCDSGCTHVLLGDWTALGAANVLARVRHPETPTSTEDAPPECAHHWRRLGTSYATRCEKCGLVGSTFGTSTEDAPRAHYEQPPIGMVNVTEDEHGGFIIEGTSTEDAP